MGPFDAAERNVAAEVSTYFVVLRRATLTGSQPVGLDNIHYTLLASSWEADEAGGPTLVHNTPPNHFSDQGPENSTLVQSTWDRQDHDYVYMAEDSMIQFVNDPHSTNPNDRFFDWLVGNIKYAMPVKEG